MHEIPTQHTAMLFTKLRPEQTDDTNVFVLHPSTHENGLDDDVDDNDDTVDGVTVGIPAQPIVVGAPSMDHVGPPWSDSSKSLPVRKPQNKSGDDHHMPVFVPSDMMKRVQEGREAFKTHLKRTSHLPYGTFDPWKLVEK